MGNSGVPTLDLKPNSDKSKEEKREIKPIVKGQVTSKKAGVGKKFMDTFFSEDLYSVKNYIIRDVLIPGIKDGLYDIFSGSLSMMFYGDTGKRRTSGTPSRTKGGYVDYSSYSSQGKKTQAKKSGVYSYNEIIFDNREDATDVKDTMHDLMERYNEVKIGDYYELAGLDCESTDWEHGWYDLSDMALVRDRDGWRIRLPKAVPLTK